VTQRTDYYDDPEGPAPNSLVPGGSALVVDDAGRVLLQRRADSGNWSLPGGVMELGETLGQAVVRETFEETGLHVELIGILGVYTNPRHVIAYADGEVRQEFVVVFTAEVVAGELRVSDESTEVRFVARAEFDSLPMHVSVRQRLSHWLAGLPTPHIG
jgi:ADP-ribose pyrophosphatase YjhB (NUDIX family)